MHANTPGSPERSTLPLFPLHTVLFPGAHLPLHIFEPRYRRLTRELVNGELPERQFGVVAIKSSLVNDVSHLDQLHPIGCAAELREAWPLPDGRFDIVSTGSRRFRLVELDSTAAPYLIGTVEWVPDEVPPAGSERTVAALSGVARLAHERYCEAAWASGDWSPPDADADPSTLAYLLASDCLLPLADRQALLAETNVLTRLRTVCKLLTREAGFLSALRAVPAPHTEHDLTKPAKLN